MARSRHRATYGELFTHHLERLLERGGPWWDVLELAKVHEAKDPLLRQMAFDGWVSSTAAFTCSDCGRVFNPLKADEDNEVICPFCQEE